MNIYNMHETLTYLDATSPLPFNFSLSDIQIPLKLDELWEEEDVDVDGRRAVGSRVGQGFRNECQMFDSCQVTINCHVGSAIVHCSQGTELHLRISRRLISFRQVRTYVRCCRFPIHDADTNHQLSPNQCPFLALARILQLHVCSPDRTDNPTRFSLLALGPCIL